MVTAQSIPATGVNDNKIFIHDFKKISNIASQLLADNNTASGITAIEIIDDGDNGEDADADAEKADAAVDFDVDQICEDIARILKAVCRKGTLASFVWDGYTNERQVVRSKTFWDALWASARTLERLNLSFYTHEVHEIVSIFIPLDRHITNSSSRPQLQHQSHSQV